jgi:hypothetical protein
MLGRLAAPGSGTLSLSRNSHKWVVLCRGRAQQLPAVQVWR